jgi:SAM-dependent methyltransferase
MDSDQVQARIMEVGQLVKKALVEIGVGAAAEEPGYKYVNGVKKPRRSPFWSRERGYKYIDDVDDHLRRLVRSFEILDPREGSAVFEIGPGNCYFLFLCRELRGCRVAGVDIKPEGMGGAMEPGKNRSRELSKYAYQMFREHFGLEDVIRHQVVAANQPIDFGGRYDYLVATRAAFNRGWGEAEYRFWLRDCYEHLRPDGKLMFYFNKIDPESLAALPLLRPQDPLVGGVKKLSMIPREVIGQVLGDREKDH